MQTDTIAGLFSCDLLFCQAILASANLGPVYNNVVMANTIGMWQ